jgi:hypothetical protein
MSTDDLNGLNVGDLIYNEHQQAMFIIELFEFERPFPGADEVPHILGIRVIVGEKSIKFDAAQVRISIHGSRCVTKADVSAMIINHIEQLNDKIQALSSLYKLAGAE